MRRKIRSDSKLTGLPVEQRLRVDAWLFEEGRTYEEVVEGCFKEFGSRVSKSSVGRYYERKSADRFAKVQREKRMALEPKLSPAEAYKVLLKRIAVLAWEEMDQPLEDINHKMVVRLVRVLIAARREKHMETRVWVERRKAENWLARECLRHWRRTMKKKPHVSYLPMWREGRVVGGTPTTAGGTPALPKDGVAGREKTDKSTLRDSCDPRNEGVFAHSFGRTTSGEFSLSYGGQMNNNQNYL
jgi:hypothetical protein